MEQKLFLIDGHSLIFRMYYAFFRHPMVNSKGEDVSILYGFVKYLFELIANYKPTHLAVCFDPPGKTFRHQLYPEYKGTRQAAPELVIAALKPLTELCEALEIPVIMVQGFEGDDVLGALAVRSAAEGFNVYMVTPDKDFGQLVSDRIFQLRPGKSGGDDEILGPAELCAKLNIENPAQVKDMLAICGDTADNVPGVNGVGEVGAAKLIARYGSVENIYAHIDELTPRQAEQFRAAEDHIGLSKTLVTIKTDIDLAVSADDMIVRSEHRAKAAELFDYYEFPSLKKYLVLAKGQEPVRTVAAKSLEWTVVSAAQVVKLALTSGKMSVAVDSDGEGIFAGIARITVATTVDGKNYASEGTLKDFSEILANSAVAKCGYDLKLFGNLLAEAGCPLSGTLYDIELMHYLINPEQSHKIEILSRTYLSVNIEEEKPSEEKTEDLGLFDTPPTEAVSVPRYKDALACLLLSDALMKELEKLSMADLYHKVEEPLISVLGRMERAGVKVDMTSLAEFSDSLRREMLELENKVRNTLEEPSLNLSSPKQVGAVLYEKLRIDPKVKPKNGSYPTDEESLMNYAENFPVIYDLLEFRGLKKLLGTYIEPFGSWISPRDGRIHTTFNQALTATGRLSSSRPNLQNIPIRTDRGKQIRKAFVASSGDNVIISADYSQIELRLMAHLCGDEHMTEAFKNGQDVHSITASKIFNLPLEEVTPQMRRSAKTANFGILYGISAFGLSQRLQIPRVAAKKLIEDYFAGFPSIKNYLDNTKQQASRDGYVQTLFGRRRYLPDINSRNATVRALAERTAINAPVQGTAADIIKLAMNAVDKRIRENALKGRMVLQIHDELLFEAPKSEVGQLCGIIKEEMENVIALSVPLTVECNYGENWLEAH